VQGASYDRSTLNFTARSTLGFIHRDFTVTTGAPAIPGLGSIIHTAGDAGLGSVDINATTTYWGMWAVDTFEMTDKWTLTFGGRVNIAQVSVRDQFETNAELNSDTTYSKFNPLIGLAYKIVPGFSAFASYSESNRVPTPLENACSNRSRPCLVESFLVSDPPLKQVVAKTYEGGLRGNMPVTEGRVEWKMSAFRTDSTDDIVHLASVIQGRGFFQNVAATQRQGIEGSFEFRSSRWHAYVNASFLDATYQFTGFLPSPNNPFADGTGNVRVNEGKRIPGIPREQGKFGLSYAVTPKWKIGGDMVVVGNQYYVGDDANQNPKLPGYWVLNVHTSYDITKNVQLFALANNVFDERYALFGTFWDPASVSNVPLAFPLTDRRIEVYGAPLAGYAGIRVRF
jgi:iron complex outermembrane receptor protein